MAVKQIIKNRLSDGRTIRALEGTFTQERIFGLYKSGKFDPAAEKIMGVKDHDDSLNKSKVWESIDVIGWWRTGRFGAYRRGFEKENSSVGERLLYIEDGTKRTLEIPDVPVAIFMPDGKSEIIGLRAARGIIDFDLEKLRYDSEEKIVSVSSDFNPKTDVRVVDVMRPRNWALVDANGYPIRSKPSRSDNSATRQSYIWHSDEFENGSTGWFGSVARYCYEVDGKRIIDALGSWRNGSGVALVSVPLPVSGSVSIVSGSAGDSLKRKR